MAIEIGSIGYNHKHDRNFIMDRPTGPGTYLFLLVKTPAIFVINGKRTNVTKNSYVIIKPSTPIVYKALKDTYIDDWFYFGLQNEDYDLLTSLGILFDTPVRLSEIDELSALIHRIAFELFSADLHHDKIKNYYTQVFFYQLSRIINSEKNTSPDLLSSKNEKLIYLRTRLFQEPAEFENIDEMAEFVNLSRSGFQHLYTKVFGKNVMQDVIAGRIAKSKDLLKSTNLTISEIASKCGYKTEYHFMRQFKEQTGFTPTQYRQSDSWNQIEATRNL